MTNSAILNLEDVSWQAGNRPILNDITFDVDPGDFISIIGPSGSGKSSLFKLIVRFIELTSGSIYFNGQDIKKLDVIQLRRNIGYILQEAFMFDGTVRDNLVFGPCLQKKNVDEERMRDLLSHVHLPEEMLDQDVSKLSGGEKQRVGIVRMLMNEPKILLLDEITSALDLANVLMVEELIKELQASMGITILMVSHDFEQARRMGGKTIILVGGRIVESGLVEDVFAHPKQDLTYKFLHGGVV